MTLEPIKTNLLAPLLLAPSGREWLALLGTVFALTCASVLVLHLFMPAPELGWVLLVHALLVAASYCVSAVLLGASVWLLARGRTRSLSTGHFWLASLAIFAVGYFLIPLDSITPAWLTAEFRHHDDSVAYFLRLLPVWLLLSYLLLQRARRPRQRDEARELLARPVHAEEIKPALAQQTPGATVDCSVAPARVRFEVGRRVLELRADCIASITVDDHYCYLRHLEGAQLRKVDLGLPLHDVLALLPSCFLQVHRSHAINVEHVLGIVRRGRKTVLLLPGGFEVPVSRHRLADILPVLERQLEREHGQPLSVPVVASKAAAFSRQRVAVSG